MFAKMPRLLWYYTNLEHATFRYVTRSITEVPYVRTDIVIWLPVGVHWDPDS